MFLLIFIIILFRKTLITKDTLEIIANIVMIITAIIAIPKIMNINKTKENIINKIKNFDKREKTYVIVLDDFDRADEEEICKLISLIKGNLDFPNFVYIFLYDRNRINLILNEKYKSHNFLEKIVNIQLDVPKIDSKNLKNFLLANTDEFISFNRYEVDSLKLVNIYIKNVRQVKRFLNQLNTDYLMLSNTEINESDFFFIEFIKYFEPDVYNLIKENYDINLDRKEKIEISNKKYSIDKTGVIEKIQETKFNSIAEQIINKTKKEDKSIIANLIYNLFPIDNLKGNNNKISSNLSCYKYFQLDINPLEFTKNDIEYFKQYFNDLESFKEKFLEKSEEKYQLAKNFKFYESFDINILKNNFYLALEKYYFNYLDNKHYKDSYLLDLINTLIYLDNEAVWHSISFYLVRCKKISVVNNFIKNINTLEYKIYFLTKTFIYFENYNYTEESIKEFKTLIINIIKSINILEFVDNKNSIKYDIVKNYKLLGNFLKEINLDLEKENNILHTLYDKELEYILLNFLEKNIEYINNIENEEISSIFKNMITIIENKNITNEYQELKDKIKEKGF